MAGTTTFGTRGVVARDSAGRWAARALVLAVLATIAMGAPAREASAADYYYTPDPALWCYDQSITPIDGDLVKSRSWDNPQLAVIAGKLNCQLLVWFEDQATGSYILPWKIVVNWDAVCSSQFPGSRYVFTPGTPNDASCAVPSPSTFRNRIVQLSGDTRTSWFVSGDSKRYWIPESSTYNCLKGQGFGGPDALPATALSLIGDQRGTAVTCGGSTLTANRVMFRNSYITSPDGRFKLILQTDGNLVLYGPSGAIWANYVASDMLIMQGDGNLVTYRFGSGATWWSGTTGTGSNRLAVQNDGNLVLYSPSAAVWTYRGMVPTPASYRSRIVQWDGDTKAQKTAWFVSPETKRYWIPDGGTYNCLKGNGFGGPDVLGSGMLDRLPDQNGSWVTCGSNTLGSNAVMFRNTYLRSADGRFVLWLQSDGNLVMYGPGGVIWANNRTSDMLIMQTDGNLVTYRFGAGATWSSGTTGTGTNRLVIQTDGNLVLYSPSRATWTFRGRL